MDTKDVISRIKDLIGKGQTEKAIDALVKYTKDTDSHLHDEVVLLSGQYKQWKRENVLGVQQTNSELRRIEMGIMNILQDKTDNPNGIDSAFKDPVVVKTAAIKEKKSNMPAIIGGAAALLLVAFAAWYFMSGNNDGNSTGKEDTSITSKEDGTPKKETGTNNTASNSNAIKGLAPGNVFEVNKKYPSNNGTFYLKFQDDGNLTVKHISDDRFVWGSYQAMAPLGGKAAILQEDGNLVIHDDNGRWIWGTQSTTAYSTLAISTAGRPQVISPSGKIVWEGGDLQRE
jgi:hypothetical protein